MINIGVVNNFRFNSRCLFGKKIGLGASKSVSTKRTFNRISDERLQELKTKQIKKRSLAKIQWAVHVFEDWREDKLKDFVNYDFTVFETSLEKVELLMKENLAYALCKFIPEVRKVKDGAPYPGQTLYQLVVAIQCHLKEKGLDWKLIDGHEFSEVKVVLDNVMEERAEKILVL